MEWWRNKRWEQQACPTTGIEHWINVTVKAYCVAITSTCFPRNMFAQAMFLMSWENIHYIEQFQSLVAPCVNKEAGWEPDKGSHFSSVSLFLCERE